MLLSGTENAKINRRRSLQPLLFIIPLVTGNVDTSVGLFLQHAKFVIITNKRGKDMMILSVKNDI